MTLLLKSISCVSLASVYLAIYDMKDINHIASALSSMIYSFSVIDESQIYTHRYTANHIILKYGLIIVVGTQIGRR